MEVAGGAEVGFIREWTPCSHILNLIPPRIQTGIFSSELCLTCVDAVSEYIALGTNVGLVYWYDRKKGSIQRLRCEAANSPITFVKIVSTVEYMVGAGNAAGQVSVFQIPKEHPDNIPDNFKPKVEPKVERYTIGDLHKSKITAIEWSKNGMRLFSGDQNGIIIMTEIDFYMHLCKSMEIVNEEHEIVQLSYHQSALLVSSVYRCIMCSLADGRWKVSQLGRRERKTLCSLGATWQHSYAGGGAAVAYCARPGLRLWRAGRDGEVLQTLLFKDAISNPLTVAELLNPAPGRAGGASEASEAGGASEAGWQGALLVFRERLLAARAGRTLLLLDPASQQCVAATDQLRRILSMSVNKDEIFVLEGPRSLVRLAAAPEPAALSPDDPLDLMSRSLSTLQSAAQSTASLLEHSVPYIASVLEQPLALLAGSELLECPAPVPGEECFELPPVLQLPPLPEEVLQSIAGRFRGARDADEQQARARELQRNLNLYNSRVNRNDSELIHSSRRSRRREAGPGSGGSTPRRATPARRDLAAAPCLMQLSVVSDVPQPTDELLEQQIREKERILAKMLNLESLSLTAPVCDVTDDRPHTDNHNDTAYTHTDTTYTNTDTTYTNTDKTYTNTDTTYTNTDKTYTNNDKTYTQTDNHYDPWPDHNTNTFVQTPTNNIREIHKSVYSGDLVPKVVKLPNNWNLDLELKLDVKGYKDRLESPDDHLDSEWEII